MLSPRKKLIILLRVSPESKRCGNKLIRQAQIGRLHEEQKIAKNTSSLRALLRILSTSTALGLSPLLPQKLLANKYLVHLEQFRIDLAVFHM